MTKFCNRTESSKNLFLFAQDEHLKYISTGKNRRDAQVGKSICCHILHKVGELGWCVVLSADATSAVKGKFLLSAIISQNFK